MTTIPLLAFLAATGALVALPMAAVVVGCVYCLVGLVWAFMRGNE